MFKTLLLIGSGSFIGGISRYLVSKYVQNSLIAAFPYGTLVVNITGCLLIGLIYGLSERGNIISSDWKIFLTVGICGGFTTFSTFANESLFLLKEGNIIQFALYAGLSVFLGVAAAGLGYIITK